MITASARSQQMWTTLYNKIVAEKVLGGRLATLTDVRKSAQLGQKLTGPGCAVQLLGWKHVKPYGQRKQIIDVEFAFLFAASSTEGSKAANLDDAMAALAPLVDAGDAVNGLIPILNDPTLFALGGDAIGSKMDQGDFNWDFSGSPKIVWAYFLQIYTATTIVSY